MKLPKIFHSIRMKNFFCIITFMVLPITIITIFSHRTSVINLSEQLWTRDQTSIQHLSMMIDSVLDSIESEGILLAHHPYVQELLAESNQKPLSQEQADQWEQWKQDYLSHMPNVLSFSLLNQNEKFVGEQTLDLNQLSWFWGKSQIRSLSQTEPTWTKSFSIRNVQTDKSYPVFAVAIPVTDADSTVMGYLILYMRASLLDQFVNAFSQDCYILDHSSNLISHKSLDPERNSTFTPNFYSVSEVAYSLLIQDSSVLLYQASDTISVTTQKYERMNWQFVFISSFSELDQNILFRISTITTICLLCIVLGTISALFISHFITQPIISLKDTMLKIQNDGLDIRYHTTTNDEIAELGQTFNSLLDQIKTLMDKIHYQQKTERKLQLQLLNAQIKPHFLYNVLEMINSFIREKMLLEATNSVYHLSHFYRISLSDGNDFVTIRDEYELTMSYLTLQQLRYVEFFDFTISIHPDLYSYSVPKLTLQPLVENAIYHGIKNSLKYGLICVVGYLQNDFIYFEIYDDGLGMSKEKISEIYAAIQAEESTQNFGIASVMKRLNIYYKNQAALKIESVENKYTNITISFPIDPSHPKDPKKE